MNRPAAVAPVLALALALALLPSPGASAAAPRAGAGLVESAEAALRRACHHFGAKVASHGGFVWEVATDGATHRRGESGDLPGSTVWVQPPGTPSVGMALLRAWEATGDRAILEGAVAAARCLARGQLASGGWHYSIEFDPERNRCLYHHIDPDAHPRGQKLRDTSTFDDDTTQSATRLLMAVDRHVDDAEIDAAVERALRLFLAAQYRDGPWDGAWPQRYPPPRSGYGRLPTFNDRTMSDCVRTLLLAWKQYRRPELLAAVNRALEFYLRSQLPAPQAGWAQQYDEDLKPAWARRFEPPAVSGSESADNVDLLLDLYIELGDPRCLAAVGRCVDWYRRSRIGGDETKGVWARFYEVGSNRPLYFTRTYELVHHDRDLPIHYSFQGAYGVDARIRRYESIRGQDPESLRAKRDRPPTAEEQRRRVRELEPRVRRLIESQDEAGRWVRMVAPSEQVRDEKGRVSRVVDETRRLPMLYSRDFVENTRVLADYLLAARGPAKPGA